MVKIYVEFFVKVVEVECDCVWVYVKDVLVMVCEM